MSVPVSNTGVPQVFSGARARFKIGEVTVGYAGGVSGEETIDYESVDVLDLLEVREHVPVAYRTTLSAQIFRVVGKSLKSYEGTAIFPTNDQIIASNALTAVVEDAEGPTPQNMLLFTGVRTAGHTFDITARGIVTENVNFVAIRVQDESENI
jgi:hypothetical protein